jgi:lipopolysaccharide-binding protein
VILDES